LADRKRKGVANCENPVLPSRIGLKRLTTKFGRHAINLKNFQRGLNSFHFSKRGTCIFVRHMPNMVEESVKSLCPTQIVNNIGIATINNPPVNSLSSDVCEKLLECFDEFEKAHVRVVVIGANPSAKVWSAGHDIREIPLDGDDAVTWTTGFERVLRRVRNCPVPVIAMLHSSLGCGLSPVAQSRILESMPSGLRF
jgi:hypothetical protein